MRFPGKSFLSPPKPPTPTPPPPLPTREDPAVAEAARRERLAAAQRRGRRATLITGGQGAEGEAPVERKTLLGA